MSSGSFKNDIPYKIFLNKLYIYEFVCVGVVVCVCVCVCVDVCMCINMI